MNLAAAFLIFMVLSCILTEIILEFLQYQIILFSNASALALSLAMPVRRATTLVHTEIPTLLLDG